MHACICAGTLTHIHAEGWGEWGGRDILLLLSVLFLFFGNESLHGPGAHFFLLCRLVASSKLFDPLSLTPLVLEIQMCTDMPAMCTTKCLAVVYMDARDPNSGPHAFTPVL